MDVRHIGFADHIALRRRQVHLQPETRRHESDVLRWPHALECGDNDVGSVALAHDPVRIPLVEGRMSNTVGDLGLAQPSHHVHGGGNGAVDHERLARADVAVGDGPPQVPRMHVLSDAVPLARLIHPDDVILLKPSCAHEGALFR
jgi:hypothetical protein